MNSTISKFVTVPLSTQLVAPVRGGRESRESFHETVLSLEKEFLERQDWSLVAAHEQKNSPHVIKASEFQATESTLIKMSNTVGQPTSSTKLMPPVEKMQVTRYSPVDFTPVRPSGSGMATLTYGVRITSDVSLAQSENLPIDSGSGYRRRAALKRGATWYLLQSQKIGLVVAEPEVVVDPFNDPVIANLIAFTVKTKRTISELIVNGKMLYSGGNNGY